MLRSLVGSEMCIRDRRCSADRRSQTWSSEPSQPLGLDSHSRLPPRYGSFRPTSRERERERALESKTMAHVPSRRPRIVHDQLAHSSVSVVGLLSSANIGFDTRIINMKFEMLAFETIV
eukprot:TRINITY_DN48686_c0_g1_i1.p1 TRINITY_DN48686_c0_g1~~TRINITY_DN48686_c0_g1_i1.p1  ORF type:complete len:119 (-),score=7.29 TRINITY_DN48686_c0_g1_i1:34-390(-)